MEIAPLFEVQNFYYFDFHIWTCDSWQLGFLWTGDLILLSSLVDTHWFHQHLLRGWSFLMPCSALPVQTHCHGSTWVFSRLSDRFHWLVKFPWTNSRLHHFRFLINIHVQWSKSYVIIIFTENYSRPLLVMWAYYILESAYKFCIFIFFSPRIALTCQISSSVITFQYSQSMNMEYTNV